MTSESYQAYRQESHREITRIYNKGGASMDTVLTRAMKTLYSDMSTFIKTSRGPRLVTDKEAAEAGATPMSIDNDCGRCEKMKKHCDHLRAENTNKGKLTRRVSEQPLLWYIIYIDQWRFRCSIFRPSRRGPRSATPWADTCAVQVSTT
jgi:hypothetical protein